MEKVELQVFSNGLQKSLVTFQTMYGCASLLIPMHSGLDEKGYFTIREIPETIKRYQDLKTQLSIVDIKDAESIIEEANEKILEIETKIEEEVYEAVKILLLEMDEKAKEVIKEILSKY